MLTAALFALALLAGAPLLGAAAAGFAIASPLGFLAAAVAWAVWNRARRLRDRSSPDAEVAFLTGVAAELDAGASLRQAIVAAASRAPDLDLSKASRLALSGSSATDVAAAIGTALPVNGRLTAAAYRIAAETGSRAGGVFSRLAVLASRGAELRRERGSLTAQARLSALVVGVAPLVFVALVLMTGRGSDLLAAGAVGLALGVVGAALILTGLVVIGVIVRVAEQ